MEAETGVMQTQTRLSAAIRSWKRQDMDSSLELSKGM